MRKLVLIIFILAVIGQATALDFNIRDSCQDSETAMFSISNLTNAHAAAPDVYQGYSGTYGREGKQVCASDDVNNINIAAECESYISNPILSFRDPDAGNTHLSPDNDAYEYTLCSSNLATSVRRSCPDSAEPIVSIYSPDENHVAEPGEYIWQICGALFTNATLAYDFTLAGNTEFVTNSGIGTYDVQETTTNQPSYGIVQNNELMSGIVGNYLTPQQIQSNKTGNRASFSINEPASHGQWFLPFTPGNYIDIEERFSYILDNNFMEQFNPNFAYEIAENTLITISLGFDDINIINNFRRGPGLYNLNITNEGTTDGIPQIKINATVS